MGRKSRIHFSGALYHAMARGVNEGDIFADDQDRREFYEILSRITAEASCQVFAFCLMTNHFHLAIKVGLVSLSSVMQRMLTAYAAYFNRRHGRTGHLFQARYKANLCLDDKYLSVLIPYIHMNPVKAGLVENPGDWPWSSYSGENINPVDLLEFNPWPDATEEKIDLVRHENGGRMELDDIVSAAAGSANLTIDDLRSRSRLPHLVEARRGLARVAVRNGHSQIAIARLLKSTRSSVSRYVRETYATTGGLTPES